MHAPVVVAQVPTPPASHEAAFVHTHTPPEHPKSGGQALPQAPQLDGSLCVPCKALHTTPHCPQFSTSVAKLASQPVVTSPSQSVKPLS